VALDLLRVDTNGFDRVLAISDIHGNLTALDTLISQVHPNENDLLVTLGDYVDRGLYSAQVLDRLIDLHGRYNLISLRGNHDQWMLDARDDPDDADFWLTIAGTSTLASYPEESIDAVPDAHWRFLEYTCVDLVETDFHIFVHGHLDAETPAEDQSTQTLQWLQYQKSGPHCSGKLVICGHSSTPSGVPETLGHTLAIETRDWLNCVDVDRGDVWRADARGRFEYTTIRETQ